MSDQLRTPLAPTAQGLVVDALSVDGPAGLIVAPLSFTVAPGETLAIIGESGSGKTMTARALSGLLPRGTSARGSFSIDGERVDLSAASAAAWARVRGSRIALLLQDPFTSLSPVVRCGEQIAMTVRARRRSSGQRPLAPRELRDEVHRRLDEVRLPAGVASQYPSELSGGMRQRVAIAAALAAEPRLLIADEPTTALDASTQGSILDLLSELQQAHHMGLMLISHDLGVVAGRADELAVMRHGEVVERGAAAQVLAAPTHAYTRALLEANPTIGDELAPAPASLQPVLVASGISKRFGSNQALAQASVEVAAGEIVAVVGESGSGKSTFARCIAGLDRPDEGTVTLAGRDLPRGRAGRKPGEMQIVFQDPYSTLNPSFTVEQSLAEALASVGRPASEVPGLLELVELEPEFAARRPAQLSGGQRQRVAIARALAPQPQLLICDESVSALDVSVQAQILALLTRLRDELGVAMLFITHDLGVVARIASRAIVLQRGEVIEQGLTAQVLRNPQHAYTRVLVDAATRDSIHQAPSSPEASEPPSTPPPSERRS